MNDRSSDDRDELFVRDSWQKTKRLRSHEPEMIKEMTDASFGKTDLAMTGNLGNRSISYLGKCIFVLFVCTICCSLTCIYDISTGLEGTLVRILDLDITEYSLLYSVYSWPNIILPLIGGVFVHRITGIRIGLLLFVFIVLIGQLGFSLAVYFNTFTVMVMSRFLIGAGSEISFVLINVFIAQWFRGNETTFLFALTFVATSFGGMFGIYLGTFLYDMFDFVTNHYSRLSSVLMVSTGIMFIATLVSILLILLDKYGKKFLLNNGSKTMSKSSSKRSFLSILKEFQLAEFWLILMMLLSFNGTHYSFLATAQLFFVSKYGLSEMVANTANSIIYGCTIFGTITGIIIDKTGYYVSWSLFGGFSLCFGAHLFFALSSNFFLNPFIGSTVAGLSYCFIASLHSVPAVLFKEEDQVIAYSIINVFQNIGYSVTDMMLGVLIDNYGYISQECFLVWLLLIGIISGVIVIFFLRNKSNVCKKQQ